MFFNAPFHLLLLCLATILAAPVSAQDNETLLFNEKPPYPIIRPLNPLNEQFLIQQRTRVEELTRRHFGQQLQTGNRNLALLQRLVDAEVIAPDEKRDLQALGVVLGDAFADNHKSLMWRVYEDELGASHAVCVAETQHCLFPVTMISRRVEGGAPVDISRIFEDGKDAMAPYLPRVPYSD